MQNLILEVDEIAKRVNAGFPNGADVESAAQIPVLFARIRELELALRPFARIGGALSNTEPELRDVYTHDLRVAYDILDRNNAKPLPKAPDFGIPAHY